MAKAKGSQKTGGRQKGTGNKVTPEIRLLARQHGAEAIEKLVSLMRGSDARLAKLERKIDKLPGDSDEMGSLLRELVGLLAGRNLPNELGAAKELIDRGWGKAALPLTSADGEGPITVERIERFIIQADPQLQLIGSSKGNGALEGPGDEADGTEDEDGDRARPALTDD